MLSDEFWAKLNKSKAYHHLYKTKWDVYHTALAILLLLVNFQLLASNVMLAVLLIVLL